MSVERARERQVGAVDPREQLRALSRDLRRFFVVDARLRDDSANPVVTARSQLLAQIRDDVRLLTPESIAVGEAAALLSEIVRLCVRSRLQPFLRVNGISHPIYNFLADYDENAPGPWDGVQPEPEALTPIDWEFLGIPIRFPLGIGASSLTMNSEWTTYFAGRGYNVLTYKTVRSHRTGAYRFPQWVFIEDRDPWFDLEEVGPVRGGLDCWPKDLGRFSTANSFGMPSAEPAVWKSDVEKCLLGMARGQLLIVSVVGSEKLSGKDFAEDFASVAWDVADAGVEVVELNLSCPNCMSSLGEVKPPLCENHADVAAVVRAVRSRLPQRVKLVAKLSAMKAADLWNVVNAIGSEVDAFSGINTVQVPIVDDHGDPVFVGTEEHPEEPRRLAGVSGSAIRELGLDQVRMLTNLKRQLRMKFAIIGMGGVTTADDVEAYRAAGADVVQSVSGASTNTRLALDVAERYRDGNPTRRRWARALATGGLSILTDR